MCMILELCEGGSLYDACGGSVAGGRGRRRLPERLAALYFRSAIDALQHAHYHGIVHCDVKTANFLLVRGGDTQGDVRGPALKLADWGMAVTQDEREVVGGSPAYQAPEHLLADWDMTDEFDQRVDVYGLGVVLYEVLVGELPWRDIVQTDDDASTDTGTDTGTDDDSDDDSGTYVDDGDMVAALVLGGMENLGITNGSGSGGHLHRPPVLDLRRIIRNHARGRPLGFPRPSMPSFVSAEAGDLISRLMEPDAHERITLGEAMAHPWFVENEP